MAFGYGLNIIESGPDLAKGLIMFCKFKQNVCIYKQIPLIGTINNIQ